MNQSVASLMSRGIKSTIQLTNGTNLSYQSTGVAIYTSTEIDRWFLGDFMSADYIINAEYGVNERETIRATLVATPGQSSITIFGRTNVSRSLINIRASASNSYVSLIVEPASLNVQGSIVSFFANYAKSTLQIKPVNSAGIATNISWVGGINLTSISFTIPTNQISGIILEGYNVSNDLIPDFATVTSWNPSTGYITIGWDTPTTIQSGILQQLDFNRSVEMVSNTTDESTTGFRTILIPQQTTIESSTKNGVLTLNQGGGIYLTADDINNELTISSSAIQSIKVAGQSDINFLDITSSPVLNVVAGEKISIITNPSTASISINSQGISVITDDNLTTTGTDISIFGGNGIATTIVNDALQITNNAYAFGVIKDQASGTIVANELTSVMQLVDGDGIAMTVSTLGSVNRLTVQNTGVLSIANKTGNISISSLISSLNTAQASGTYINTGVNAVAMMYFINS